ncbi:fermitin family homolog 2-like [Microtus oregoni]|uniref:fermitin family homolog 2-like n=1 Tax=Microtus oregoni TaxID=111838 RepID=UPI001BB16A27|nr:fermitin family homolog 2-like [Microtus oregoni]
MPRALAVREPTEVLKDVSSRGFLLSPASQHHLPMDMLKQAEGQRSYSDKERCSSIQGEGKKSRIPRFRQQTEGSNSDELLARPRWLDQNVAQMSLIEAKMRFIQAWQSLPEFGITHFIARFQGGKREELIGIAYNRLIRMDAITGDAIKTWQFSNMKQWNVNWEIKMVTVEFADEVRLSFIYTEVDCKVAHEFIGGYIFLSTRAKDQNESLDEEIFYKLTSGWV